MEQQLHKTMTKQMNLTTGNLNSIRGHLQIINSQENTENEDLHLLYGRLQYQVKQLELDLKSQGQTFSKTLNQTGGFKVNTNEQIETRRNKERNELLQYERQPSFNETNPLAFMRYNSPKEIMSASKGFLLKTTYTNAMKSTATSLRKTQSNTNIMSSQNGFNNDEKKNFHQTKTFLAKPGRISNTEVLPRHIRKNPFSDLPPISEKDLSKGLIPKDLDLLPAFNQGAPILEASKKMQFSPQAKQQQTTISKEFPEKYKLDYNINNASSIFHGSQLMQSASHQHLSATGQESQFFITDTQIQQKNVNKLGSINRKKSSFKFNTAQYLLQNKQEQPIQNAKNEIVVGKRFYLTIKNGYIIQSTTDYKQMKSLYSEQWGSINGLIKKLENISKKYEIKLLHIDGMKVVYLFLIQNQLLEISNDLTRVRLDDLIGSIINKEMIKKVIPAEHMASFRGKAWATLKILCSFKMRKAIKQLRKMRENQSDNAEKRWKVTFWLRYIMTQRKLSVIQKEKFNSYFALQKSFEQNFNQIINQKRVEIHINSLSVDEFKRMTIEHFAQSESLQLTRMFAIKDPNVEIIMVMPYELPHEIISYYYKICELGDLTNYKERLHFIWPENSHIFPNFSTIKLLYYSPISLKKIKDLIEDKPAFIVTGIPCKEDSLVGMTLKVPIFCGNYEIVNNICKKSQSKILFEECKFPTAPGAENISDEEDLINKLTILIAKYSNVNTWIFKIDGEFKGRGIAFFSLESIRVLSDIRKQKKEIDELQVSKIREIVSSLLPSKTQICIPTLFQNYSEFLYYFLEHKGIIEASPLSSLEEVASPSVFFRLDPDGQSHVLASYDKIQGQDYVNFGCIFPQQSLPSLNLKQLCSTLGDKLHQKGIYGYITVDMIAFPDPSNKLNHPLFWLIGLDCYLNDYSSSYFIFDFLSKGKIDKITGKYYLGRCIPEKMLQEENEMEGDDSEQSNIIDEFEERSFMYIPYIYHRGLHSMGYRDFFYLCRKNSISFDIEKKSGSVFLLIDNIERGVLSLMTISESSKKNIKLMTDALNFVLQIAGVVQRKTQKDVHKRSDQLYLMDIISKVRLLNKNNEKQMTFYGSANSPQNNDKSY